MTDRNSLFYDNHTIRAIKEQKYQYAIDVVNEQPTVDAVPVVRCKYCKYRITEYYDNGCGEKAPSYYCGKDICMVWHGNRLDYFCADGERKEVSE